MTTQSFAERAEESINLRRQINGLEGVADADFVFQDTSPPKYWDFVYSTETGERIRVARHRLISILEKKLLNGQPAFTANKDNAPEYRLGTIKCFLARGSDYRELVDQLNISPGYYCPAEHIPNEVAAQTHAEHRHATRWRMLRDHLDRQERAEERQRQEAQIAAILELARGRATPDAEPVLVRNTVATAAPEVTYTEASPYLSMSNNELRRLLMDRGMGLDWPEYKWKRLSKAKLVARLSGG